MVDTKWQHLHFCNKLKSIRAQKGMCRCNLSMGCIFFCVQHFLVCANAMILSLLYVAALHSCCKSLECQLKIILLSVLQCAFHCHRSIEHDHSCYHLSYTICLGNFVQTVVRKAQQILGKSLNKLMFLVLIPMTFFKAFNKVPCLFKCSLHFKYKHNTNAPLN